MVQTDTDAAPVNGHPRRPVAVAVAPRVSTVQIHIRSPKRVFSRVLSTRLVGKHHAPQSLPLNTPTTQPRLLLLAQL